MWNSERNVPNIEPFLHDLQALLQDFFIYFSIVLSSHKARASTIYKKSGVFALPGQKAVDVKKFHF